MHSVHKPFHSMASVLVKVQNDILCAIDQQHSVILLFDLATAFDTVDHELLMSRLRTKFGIKDNYLRWLSLIFRIANSLFK